MTFEYKITKNDKNNLYVKATGELPHGSMMDKVIEPLLQDILHAINNFNHDGITLDLLDVKYQAGNGLASLWTYAILKDIPVKILARGETARKISQLISLSGIKSGNLVLVS